MQTVRGQPKNNVADLHILAGDDLLAIHYANDESGQIVLAIRIKPGHLRRLAPDQRAPIVLAGIGDPLHHFLCDRRIEGPRRQVIHKKQRRSTLHRNVIHAVVHQIGADRRVQVHLKRDLQLRAHSVHTRDQHRVGVLRLIHRKQSAEAANFAQHAASEGFVSQVLDALLGAVRAADVNPGIGVRDRRRTGRGSLGHSFFR